MAPSPSPAVRRTRCQRGVAFPSPLVMLSVIAIAMAAVAFVVTQDQPSLERRIETTSQASSEESATADQGADQRAERERPARKEEKKPKKPEVVRGDVYVEVYNNSGIGGLAATTAAKATGVGWQVVGEDNWYGAIPASTVYYPGRLRAAAELLALDLGIDRVQPAVDPMRMDRLTVVLTADAA